MPSLAAASFHFLLSPLRRREQERKAAELAEAEEREKYCRTRDYRIYTVNETYKTTVARSKQIVDWFQNGGVMLMGYEMYRLLVSHKVRGGVEAVVTCSIIIV